MINQSTDIFIELKKTGTKERRLIKEFMNLSRTGEGGKEEKKMVSTEIQRLKKDIEKNAKDYLLKIENINLTKPLKKVEELSGEVSTEAEEKKEIDEIEKNILKRYGKEQEKAKIKKKKKPRIYVGFANKLFFKYSEKLFNKYRFIELRKNLLKTNMQFVPENYLSIIIFTTIISFAVSLFLLLFITIFDLSFMFPFISFANESLLIRFIRYSWLIVIIPLGVGLFTYYYPSLEKQAASKRINQELPFATIHMAAISESMLNPKGIFEILIKTGEYNELAKEFTKLINEINIHGTNLVNALRSSAIKSPSANLTDLFNGLATTINSGGKLKEFFDKRSQTLLFEYKIAEEKSAKVAETFMDIYISIVIAAPMILMLLLMIMNVSGIGLQLTPSIISVMMIAGVAVINMLFLMFIHLKSPSVT